MKPFSTIRYAALKENDIVNGEDVCVSLWTQGCPFHCPGCHNPETWDFNGGIEEDFHILLDKIIKAINKNEVIRNFSILGGEPLCNENVIFTWLILKEVRKHYPYIKIFLWTGYTKEELIRIKKKTKNTITNKEMFRLKAVDLVDILVTGRYEQDKRDITLELRGSTNQEILIPGIDF
jgi:anaerobic ribonucleoside-triphosphate reductase activating protein